MAKKHSANEAPKPPHPKKVKLIPPYSAARDVHGTTEILEQILLSVDEKTLLQMVIHALRARDVFQGSNKLKKKLWIIQPTFEEKVKMGDVHDDTEIFSPYPGQATLRNPLVTVATELERPHNISLGVKLRSRIVHDKMHSVHGLWERMHISTRADVEDGSWYQLAVKFDVNVKATEILEYGDVEDGHVEADEGGRGGLPGGQLYCLQPATAELFTMEWPMLFSAYKKMSRLAAKEGATDWVYLSIWEEDPYLSPNEEAIDAALEMAGLVGDAMGAESGSEGEGKDTK